MFVFMYACEPMSTYASTTNAYHVSHAQHVFPTNSCTHPKMETQVNRSEHSTFPKEAQLMENERSPVLGQEDFSAQP